MRKVEHTHAKNKSGFGFRKLLGWIAIFWVVTTALSLLAFVLPDWVFSLFFFGIIGVIGYYVWRMMKKGLKIPFLQGVFPQIEKLFPQISTIIPNNSVKQKQALNLELNRTLNIENPYSGVFISGGAGAGKSKSIIEPLIADCGRKGFTGVIYDFKFPELASYVATAYEDSEIQPYYFSLSDLNRSHRINPIAPELMINESYAREFAYSILVNLNPKISKDPDFWSDNSFALLTATFWYLKKRHPKSCTLPHAMSMITRAKTEALLTTLSQEPECADMIAPIVMAYDMKAEGQLTGAISSLMVSLGKMISKELFYLMSASDFNIDLNNPNSKGILCIGNDPTLASAYSPILGLLLTSVSKILNQQGKEKSVFMVDEFPTVYIPNVEQLPATARSNKVATILACQDIAQMVDKYGREKSDTILSNLGNQFYGRTTSLTTAERVNKMFGKADKLMKTDSNNYDRSIIGDRRKGSGTSYAYQERDLVKVQDVLKLKTGSFYTILSEGKARQGLVSIPMDKRFTKTDILPFRSVDQWDLNQNFERIKSEVEYILGLS